MSATKFTTTALTPAATSKVAAELAAGTKGHFLLSALQTFFGIGTTTNDNAAAGQIGEYISSSVDSGSAVGLTTNTPANVTSISLTAGDWDVTGSVGFELNGATVLTQIRGALSATSATLPTPGGTGAYFIISGTLGTGTAQIAPTGTMRFSLASTTTIYLVARATFTTNTCGAYGYIAARRVR